jgi:hypothetical protein
LSNETLRRAGLAVYDASLVQCAVLAGIWVKAAK